MVFMREVSPLVLTHDGDARAPLQLGQPERAHSETVRPKQQFSGKLYHGKAFRTNAARTARGVVTNLQRAMRELPSWTETLAHTTGGIMTKLILDLDTGIDDTLALLYALASPEAELIGIAGTFGNVSVETGVANDLALLELFGRPDIPVFAGIDHPSWADSFSVMPESRRFHGRNGTGDVEIPARARAQAQTQSAVDFIVDAVRAMSPEDLIVIPTGASTNIAAALEAAPDTVGRARIVMMGGSLTQPGNVTPLRRGEHHAGSGSIVQALRGRRPDHHDRPRCDHAGEALARAGGGVPRDRYRHGHLPLRHARLLHRRHRGGAPHRRSRLQPA